MVKKLRKNILKARKGYKHSVETKKKMSKIAKRLNRHISLKQSIESQKKKIKDNLGNVFNSLGECARYWSIHTSTVCDILKGRHSQTRKKVKFYYA